MSTLKLGTLSKTTMIAGFDLDWTLIHSPRGMFPKDANDWKLLPLREQRLKSLHQVGYTIVIVTNQKSKGARRTTLTNRLINIYNYLKDIIPNIVILASFEDDQYRKPNTGLWKFTAPEGSFYCGDADGSDIAFADTDLKFAENIGVPFISVHSNKMFPSYFQERPFKFPSQSTMILMVGSPKSGGSRLCKHQFKDWLVVERASKPLNRSLVCKGMLATKAERAPLIKLANESGFKVVILVIKRDPVKNSVPDVVYHSWYSKFEQPTEDEGEIIEVW